MHEGDRVFVVGNPDTLRESLPMLNASLKEHGDGSLSVADTLGGSLGGDSTATQAKAMSRDEEQKHAANTSAGPSKQDVAAYQYLMPSAEGRESSPLKEKVSRVFFAGTEVPL